MVISRKYLFLIVNFIMMAGIMWSVTDFPMASQLPKIKFVFMFYCLIDLLSCRKIPCSINTALIFAILLFYYAAWRYVFLVPLVMFPIIYHTRTLFMFWGMLVLASMEVIRYDCVEEYTVTSGAALMLVLFYQTATHLEELIWNPVFAIHSFFAHDLVRASFGYVHMNFAGNACFLLSVILLMVYLYYSRNPLVHSRIKIAVVILEALVFYILLSISSRTAFLGFFIFAGGAFVIEIKDRLHFTKESVRILIRAGIIGAAGLIAVFLFTDAWDVLMVKSNRALNISMNLRWVPVIGNIWTGMGLVENAAFVTDASTNWTSAFGVATSSLDMNYLYIYCTTGILGCLLTAAILILIGIGLYKNRKQKYGAYFILLYLVILFYALWETVLFTYRFWAMLIPHVILMYGANTKETTG